MTVTTAEFERGMILKIDSNYWEISEFQFVNPGKGSAFTRTILKNLTDGRKLERTYKSGEEFEEVEYEKITAEFLYADRKSAVFLTEKKKERISIPLEIMGDKMGYLIPKTMVELMMVEGQYLDVLLPKKVDLKVTESPPNLRGNTAGAVTKTVKVETGLVITVPAFIEEGDVIRVNTEKGEYSERINK
ncbi:MAG: elongation factor P [Candidatus Paceibacterota bacterium]